MLEHINWKMMGLGIIFGIIASYVVKPEKRVIIRYPDPTNAGARIYRDNNSTCFKFSATEVNCEASEENLADFPLQN